MALRKRGVPIFAKAKNMAFRENKTLKLKDLKNLINYINVAEF